MRVGVYEHLTANGLGRDSGMYDEGRAMRDALTADLAAVPGVAVVEPDAAEAVIVIAPETGGVLEERVRHFRRLRRVIGPTADAVALTADKLALAEHWQRCGVPTPFTTSATDWPTGRGPAVFKPRDGAGSCDTSLRPTTQAGMIAQDFVPGRPASVAFLIGPKHVVALAPTFQQIEGLPAGTGAESLGTNVPGVASPRDVRPRAFAPWESDFHYLGGELPIPPPFAARAVDLGRRAVECVPGLSGYVGVDLVLGEREDVALEINPRFTTSYVGLRALADANLAAALLAVFGGGRIESLAWKPGRIAFRADGGVSWR